MLNHKRTKEIELKCELRPILSIGGFKVLVSEPKAFSP
jgi:hypothetical protein